MKLLAVFCAGLGVLAIIVVVAFVAIGPDRFWRFAGPPDLGPVVFEQLERRQSPNDALACPLDICAAPADIATKLYPVTAPDLRAAFAQVIASEQRVEIVSTDDGALADRYIQRTKWLGFPDTISVQFFERPDGQSTLAVYSRSQLGESDLGANRERVERWLSGLAERVQPVE